MKKIDLSNVVEGVRTVRIPAETYEHMQEAYTEGFQAMLDTLGCDPNEIVILSGAVVTENGQDYDVTAGWVAYQNEIFQVDVTNFTAPGGQTAVWVIDTTHIAEDPILYDDGSQHDSHPIRKMTIQAGLSGSGEKDWDDTQVIYEFMRSDGNISLKTKVIEIGEWDMDASSSVQVAHGLPNANVIRSISATIVNDDGNAISDLICASVLGGFELSGGINTNNSGNVILSRVNGGFFDTLAFNQASGYNRGWITITYQE